MSKSKRTAQKPKAAGGDSNAGTATVGVVFSAANEIVSSLTRILSDPLWTTQKLRVETVDPEISPHIGLINRLLSAYAHDASDRKAGDPQHVATYYLAKHVGASLGFRFSSSFGAIARGDAPASLSDFVWHHALVCACASRLRALKQLWDSYDDDCPVYRIPSATYGGFAGNSAMTVAMKLTEAVAEESSEAGVALLRQWESVGIFNVKTRIDDPPTKEAIEGWRAEAFDRINKRAALPPSFWPTAIMRRDQEMLFEQMLEEYRQTCSLRRNPAAWPKSITAGRNTQPTTTPDTQTKASNAPDDAAGFNALAWYQKETLWFFDGKPNKQAKGTVVMEAIAKLHGPNGEPVEFETVRKGFGALREGGWIKGKRGNGGITRLLRTPPPRPSNGHT